MQKFLMHGTNCKNARSFLGNDVWWEFGEMVEMLPSTSTNLLVLERIYGTSFDFYRTFLNTRKGAKKFNDRSQYDITFFIKIQIEYT